MQSPAGLGEEGGGVELTPLPVYRMAAALLACLAVAGANKTPDPYKEGDPIHDDAFRKAYLHNDGTINEKVLVKLHEYRPAAPRAPPRECDCIVGICCTEEARPSPPLEHSTNTPIPARCSSQAPSISGFPELVPAVGGPARGRVPGRVASLWLESVGLRSFRLS